MTEKHKFIDTFTNVEFECSLDDFANAYDSIIDDDVYEMYGYITLNDYYSILGIDTSKYYLGLDYGWKWVHFKPIVDNICNRDGELIFCVSYAVPPRKLNELRINKKENEIMEANINDLKKINKWVSGLNMDIPKDKSDTCEKIKIEDLVTQYVNFDTDYNRYGMHHLDEVVSAIDHILKTPLCQFIDFSGYRSMKDIHELITDTMYAAEELEEEE